jgi:hypothetical protein
MNDWRERARRLRDVALAEVLRCSDARADRADAHKWHTRRGVLSVTGAKFINWTLGQGGGGAIDLVMHLQQLGFGQALEWLESRFDTPVPASPSPPAPPPPPTLALPRPSPVNPAPVHRYLVEQRQLPPTLLAPLLCSGDLYADARANAVFLLRDPSGRPVGAELRGTTVAAWRGMAPGSRKDLGFFAVPADPLDGTVLCESAIDALSCHALHPRWRCLSTAGARANPAWLADLARQTRHLLCGFDLDPTGEAMARAMMVLHPSIRRLRPTRKDWNDVLRLGP